MQIPPESKRKMVAVYAPASLGATPNESVQGSGFRDGKLRGTLAPGSAVEVDLHRTAVRKNIDYVWITQGNLQGFVKRAAVVVQQQPSVAAQPATSSQKAAVELIDADANPRQAADGPKAGFEHEFKTCFVFPSDAEAALKRRAARPQGVLAKLYLEREAPKRSGAPFVKGTKIFSAPHKTWSATTDTTFASLSNLEIVSEPLTPEEMESEEAAEDRRILDAVIARLAKAEGTYFSVLEPASLVPGLIIHKDVFMLANGDAGFMQLTEAVKLPDTQAPDETWLDGLKPGAWPLLLRTGIGIEDRDFTGTNPKERLPLLLKTPLSSVLGKAHPDETEDRRTGWMQWVVDQIGAGAKIPSLKLDDHVGARMVADYNRANGADAMTAPDFTWRQFLSDLLAGTDRLATWSRAKPFGGQETFGYGVVDDPSLNGEWYVEEARHEGISTSAQLTQQQKDWKAHVRSTGLEPRKRTGANG